MYIIIQKGRFKQNMKTIIGVRLKKIGKVYYFDPENYNLNVGDYVIVETALGEEYAEVVIRK